MDRYRQIQQYIVFFLLGLFVTNIPRKKRKKPADPKSAVPARNRAYVQPIVTLIERDIMKKDSLPYARNTDDAVTTHLSPECKDRWDSIQGVLAVRRQHRTIEMFGETASLVAILGLVLLSVLVRLLKLDWPAMPILVTFALVLLIMPLCDLPRHRAESREILEGFLGSQAHNDALQIRKILELLRKIGFKYQLHRLSWITIGSVCDRIDALMTKYGYHLSAGELRQKPKKVERFKKKMREIQAMCEGLGRLTGEIWVKPWDQYIPGQLPEDLLPKPAAVDGEAGGGAQPGSGEGSLPVAGTPADAAAG